MIAAIIIALLVIIAFAVAPEFMKALFGLLLMLAVCAAAVAVGVIGYIAIFNP